jgi:DNA-binding Xre family transcriptional regulator
MTLTELSDRVGVTTVNLSVLKNGRADQPAEPMPGPY